MRKRILFFLTFLFFFQIMMLSKNTSQVVYQCAIFFVHTCSTREIALPVHWLLSGSPISVRYTRGPWETQRCDPRNTRSNLWIHGLYCSGHDCQWHLGHRESDARWAVSFLGWQLASWQHHTNRSAWLVKVVSHWLVPSDVRVYMIPQNQCRRGSLPWGMLYFIYL